MESAGISPPVRGDLDYASQMKDLAKKRMQRQVFQDPSKAAELVKVEATSTYNADAHLVQSASMSLGFA